MFFLLGDEAEHITICSNLSDAGQLKGYPSWMQPQSSNRRRAGQCRCGLSRVRQRAGLRQDSRAQVGCCWESNELQSHPKELCFHWEGTCRCFPELLLQLTASSFAPFCEWGQAPGRAPWSTVPMLMEARSCFPAQAWPGPASTRSCTLEVPMITLVLPLGL